MHSLFKAITLTAFVTLTIPLLSSCSSRNQNRVTIISHAADGLDLKAVTDAATKSSSAEEFEKKLNVTGNKINNLDLNEDNKVDYIKVTEINKGDMKGFSLTVEISAEAEQEQEVCTIQFEKTSDGYQTQTHGNRHIYGDNYYYRRSSLGDMLIMSYFLRSHSPYRSSYGYGRYPSHFSSQAAPVSKSQYSGFHQSQSYSKGFQRATRSQATTAFTSPNATKTASKIKAPLKSPSSSQKSFQKSNPSKSVRSSSSSSSRFGSSSSSRSRSSFGGGKN